MLTVRNVIGKAEDGGVEIEFTLTREGKESNFSGWCGGFNGDEPELLKLIAHRGPVILVECFATEGETDEKMRLQIDDEDYKKMDDWEKVATGYVVTVLNQLWQNLKEEAGE